MEEKMARERIEGEITSREWAESQFLRAAMAWDRLSWKAKGATVGGLLFLGGIAGWRAREGRVELPAVSPAEGKETILEVSQAQAAAPKIVVPPEAEKAPEYIERAPIEAEEKAPVEEVSLERTVEFLGGLQKKVDEIYDLRRKRVGIGASYIVIVKEKDILWDIAEKHKISVGRILELNPEIKDPNLIFPDQKLRMPEDVVPSQALGEIFDQVETDLVKLQTFIESGKQNSSEAKKTIKEIVDYWNTAPGEKEEVKEPEIIVNPEAENGEWIAEQLREFLQYLPNSGRVVEKIFIVSKEDWPYYPFGAKADTFPSYSGHIQIAENTMEPFSKEKKEWTQEELLSKFLHELGHCGSLYSEGYNLQFLTPAEVVALVYEDTLLWGEAYKEFQEEGSEWALWLEEEENASIAPIFMTGEESTHYPAYGPDYGVAILKGRLELMTKLFSKQLGKEIDFIELGKQLGFR